MTFNDTTIKTINCIEKPAYRLQKTTTLSFDIDCGDVLDYDEIELDMQQDQSINAKAHFSKATNYNLHIKISNQLVFVKEKWSIDITKTGTCNNCGGIIDGSVLANNEKYILWASAREKESIIEKPMQHQSEKELIFDAYFLTLAPIQINISNEGVWNKGYNKTFNITNAYKFSLNSKVKIGRNNKTDCLGIGTIITRTNTSITINLDNHPDFSNIANNAKMDFIQITNFTPNDVNTGEVIRDHFALLDLIEVQDSVLQTQNYVNQIDINSNLHNPVR